MARRKLQSLAGNSVAEGNKRKIGVILDVMGDESLSPFLRLGEDLSLEQDEIRLVFSKEKSVKNDIFEHPLISYEDFSWTGKISESASDFLNAQYDVLVSFTSKENKVANFLVSVTRARLKVGRKREGENAIFDLNISAEISEAEVFIHELKKYLKILNTTT